MGLNAVRRSDPNQDGLGQFLQYRTHLRRARRHVGHAGFNAQAIRSAELEILARGSLVWSIITTPAGVHCIVSTMFR